MVKGGIPVRVFYLPAGFTDMVLNPESDIFVIDTKPLGHEELISSYLVKGSGGVALIDPGFPCSADTVLSGIEEAGVDPAQIKYLLLTHTHVDHSGGAGQILQKAENARIVTHKRGEYYLKNSGKITGGSRMVFGADLAGELGEAIDIPGERIETVGDGDTVDLGDKEFTVFRTPGHAGDHISLLEKSTGSLFTGDTACLQYPQLNHVPVPAGSPPVYRTDFIISELSRFKGQEVRHIMTPHYGESDLDIETFVESNIKSVKDTYETIKELFSQGLEFSQVIEKLRASILKDAGVTGERAPEFLTDTWLTIMLQVGLMGYMADILQYARDIRCFHTEAMLDATKR